MRPAACVIVWLLCLWAIAEAGRADCRPRACVRLGEAGRKWSGWCGASSGVGEVGGWDVHVEGWPTCCMCWSLERGCVRACVGGWRGDGRGVSSVGELRPMAGRGVGVGSGVGWWLGGAASCCLWLSSGLQQGGRFAGADKRSGRCLWGVGVGSVWSIIATRAPVPSARRVVASIAARVWRIPTAFQKKKSFSV